MSNNPYVNYYLNQVGQGHTLPVYSGLRVQRGSGFGNFLGNLFRSAVPLLKKGAVAVGKQALKTGLQVASDVASGENIKSSLKRRAVDSAKSLGQTAIKKITSQPTIKKSKKSILSSKKKRKGKKKLVKDVFTSNE